MRFDDLMDRELIAARLGAHRPSSAQRPDVSVVVPVNAQGDLSNVVRLLGDLARYAGPHRLEVILVVNNFPDGDVPAEVDGLRQLGARVIAIPSVRRPGEAVGFSARIPGVAAATSEQVVLFDADCRIPDSTALLDWYVDQFRRGAQAAYTHVAYYDYRDALSIRFRFAVHNLVRWGKRSLFRIPTTRGSNYAVRRGAMLELYERGMLADEMNVGPTFKRLKGRVAYSGRRALVVYTSGRMFRPGWGRILPYLLYRLKYNLRVLPVRADVARRTGRERDPVRRYVSNRPVRDPSGAKTP
ncbi:MAG TPA: glycosyltransferase [Gemmatimonadaceae bacterium]|jgi:hypothetical protein